MTKKEKREILPYLIPALFFAGLWFFGEIGIYNDSHQYIAMHIHREPLYPFFLWIFRNILGEAVYLEAVRFLQNLLAAVSVISLAAVIKRQFSLKNGMTFLICMAELLPYIITPLFSESGLVFSNGIVSEALGLPLFYLFAAQMLDMLLSSDKKAAVLALFYALLLALTRGQMMAAILVWMVCAGVMAIVSKAYRRLLPVILAVVLVFAGRSFLVKSYNAAFNGHFINNTFGSVGMLANILYAADRENGEKIEDEKAREFFYLSYDLAYAQEANYQFAPKGFLNRASHVEKWNDTLKFEMIEQAWREVHDRTGFPDYIPENVESDRVAGLIMKDILPEVLGRWLYDYLALIVYGMIRSIAVVHPLLNWYALLAYFSVIGLIGFAFYRDKNSKAGKMAVFVLLSILANVCSTSLIIMCLSRYMIYMLPLFYISGLLLLREVIPLRGKCQQQQKEQSFP